MLVLAVTSCSEQSEHDDPAILGPAARLAIAARFTADDATRPSVLEESVAEFETPYGALRVAEYAAWSSLPELSPEVREFIVDGGAAAPAVTSFPELAPTELDAWLRLGELVFSRYPAQVDLSLERMRDRDLARSIGFEVDPSGVVWGLAEMRTQSGWAPAFTCAACHSTDREGTRVIGLSSETLDFGYLTGHEWRKGTIDVTADGVDNPVRPSDLRPIVYQSRLHHTGNLRNGPMERMLRIETLLITSHRMRVRPPRHLVAALGLYLESLADSLPTLDWSHPGARVFVETCSDCHSGRTSLAGPSLALEVVPTDPAATLEGTERGTGAYRAPSLRGVADRRRILHDGSVFDLPSLLRDRAEPSAHSFGVALSAEERESLIEFLSGN